MNDLDIIQIINKAAWEVRVTLYPGFLESVYQNALMIELQSRGLYAEKEVAIPVYYKGAQVGDFRADILVNSRIIIELKASRELNPAHEAQLVNYLTATGLDYGILINFGGEKFAFRVKTREYSPKQP